MDSHVRLRTATPADLDPVADLWSVAFHERLSPERRAAELGMLELDRSLVAEDDGRIVGHATALSRDLTVPGATVPAAHVTGVAVASTHRRQGLLTAMMRRQLGDIAEAGREPVAVLWASEGAIYPRFGYGPAASRLALQVANREARLPAPTAAPTGRLRLVEPLAATADLAVVYERLRPDRVGWSSRGERWWRYLLTETDEPRGDGPPLQGVLYETGDGPQGYALWHGEPRWSEWGPDGRIRVREMVADGTEAYAALWRFLLDLDLTRTVEFGFAAVDEPVQYLISDARRLGRRLLDGLWVRLVDLPAALEARAYAAPLDVVIEVADPILEHNTGRWHLAGEAGKATCTRTGQAPDLACSVTELGAAYLGGVSLAALAAAGRIEQLTDNLPTAAFGAARLPNPIETF